MPLVSSLAIRLLYQKFDKRIWEIVKEYLNFTRQGISRHAKLPIPVDSDDVVLDKRHDNPGRSRSDSAVSRHFYVPSYLF